MNETSHDNRAGGSMYGHLGYILDIIAYKSNGEDPPVSLQRNTPVVM